MNIHDQNDENDDSQIQEFLASPGFTAEEHHLANANDNEIPDNKVNNNKEKSSFKNSESSIANSEKDETVDADAVHSERSKNFLSLGREAISSKLHSKKENKNGIGSGLKGKLKLVIAGVVAAVVIVIVITLIASKVTTTITRIEGFGTDSVAIATKPSIRIKATPTGFDITDKNGKIIGEGKITTNDDIRYYRDTVSQSANVSIIEDTTDDNAHSGWILESIEGVSGHYEYVLHEYVPSSDDAVVSIMNVTDENDMKKITSNMNVTVSNDLSSDNAPDDADDSLDGE